MPTHVTNADKGVAGGVAALDETTRSSQGVDTTDDVIIDTTAKGLVLKDSNGHYWRLSVTLLGLVLTADLGTTKP